MKICPVVIATEEFPVAGEKVKLVTAPVLKALFAFDEVKFMTIQPVPTLSEFGRYEGLAILLAVSLRELMYVAEPGLLIDRVMLDVELVARLEPTPP